MPNSDLPGLSSVIWRNLNEWTSVQTFSAAVELFREGDQPRELFLIERGIVKLVHWNSQGREVILNLHHSGWPLGAAAIIGKRFYPATGVTVTPCRLHRIAAEALLRLLEADLHLNQHFLKLLSREIHSYVTQLRSLATSSARQRLACLLHQLATRGEALRTKEGVRMLVPLRHWEMAEFLNISPQYLCRLFKDLETEGVLLRKKSWVILRDIEALGAARQEGL